MNFLSMSINKVSRFFKKKFFDGGFGASWIPLLGGKYNKKELYVGLTYSSIDAIADAVASAQFKMYKYQGNKKIEVMEHFALKLLNKPTTTRTKRDMLYEGISHLLIWGKWYLLPNYNILGTRAVELQVLHPMRVLTWAPYGVVDKYIYYALNGGTVEFTPEEIIVIHKPNPFNPIDGISALDMARDTIELDQNAKKWNKNFFANGAIPSGNLTTDQQLNDDTLERLRKQFNETYTGIDNAHKIMITEQGLKWDQIAPRQKEMDFVESRKFNRDEIISTLRVPKTILGITDEVNRANAESSEYVFAKWIIEPLLHMIDEKLTQMYLPFFPSSDGLFIEHVSTVPEDKEIELKTKETGINKWMTVNEVRAKDGLPPVENGDTIYMPNNLVPLGEKPPMPIDNPPAKRLTKAAKPKTHIAARDTYLEVKEALFAKKLHALYKGLIKDIKKKDFQDYKKKRGEQTPTMDEVIAEISWDRGDWKKMYGLMEFDLGVPCLTEATKQVALAYGLQPMTESAMKKVIEWLRSQIQDSGDSIDQSIYDRVKEVIARNLSDGVVDIGLIRDDVANILGEEEDWRVERITRTELFTAYGESQYQTFKDNKVENLVWHAAEDERTCEECAANDNEVVPFGENFPSGDAHEPAHIQCRCGTMPTSDETT